MALNIVLVEPRIPPNTGTIARTCALTQTRLHLVRPLGFETTDKALKRAGLDYWHLLDVKYYDSFDEVLKENENSRFYYLTTKGKKFYTEVQYRDGDFLVFGREDQGLSDEILKGEEEHMIKVPMRTEIKRSLNLSNTANIVLFEAYRQLDFPFLK